MQQLFVNVPRPNEREPGNETLHFPVGVRALIAGNFLWENRLIARMVAHYFPEAKTTQLAESLLMDVLPSAVGGYDLIILDEMLLCGDYRGEILRALESGYPAVKVVVYGARFFNDPVYSALIDLRLSKALTMEEIACQLCMAMQ